MPPRRNVLAEIGPGELGVGVSCGASRRDRVGVGVRIRPGQRTTTDEPKQPNILFIMGDDIGWMQVVSYQGGLALGETPNIDRIAQ